MAALISQGVLQINVDGLWNFYWIRTEGSLLSYYQTKIVSGKKKTEEQ